MYQAEREPDALLPDEPPGTVEASATCQNSPTQLALTPPRIVSDGATTVHYRQAVFGLTPHSATWSGLVTVSTERRCLGDHFPNSGRNEAKTWMTSLYVAWCSFFLQQAMINS